MRNLCAAVIVALFHIGIPLTAFAQDVTLTSRDGTVQVSGHLLGFDGTFYRIDSIYGELTLDGSGVICNGPGCPDLESYVAEFSIAGSRTIGETLMPALIEAFAADKGYAISRKARSDTEFTYVLAENGKDVARVGFRVTSSDEGFADLLANEADISLSMREIRMEETALGKDAGLGNLGAPGRSRVLALDGIVPIVSPLNPVKNISLENIMRIFAGQISNWSELGGVDAPMVLHAREAKSGLQQAFEDVVLGAEKLTLTAGVTRHKSNVSTADAVSRDPFAIGITSFSEIGNARAVRMPGTCGFVVEPSVLSLKTEDYPLTTPMLLYTPARRLPQAAREFLSYLRTPPAQLVIRRAGFVDQAPALIPLDAQGARLANAISASGDEVPVDELRSMVERLRGLSRLTSTFRFKVGSSDLDAQSRSNVEQLARLIEAGFYDGKSIVFVGFSDGDGAAATNKRLARARARVVRDAVLLSAPTADRDRLTVRIEAFGEALPMACDDTPWGRQVNRRVEVWVD